MKRFTIRDFIALNAPCFGCGSQVNVTFGLISDPPLNVYLKPAIQSNLISVDLKITYDAILKLTFDSKNNKFSTNNVDELKVFLSNNKLYLSVDCPVCRTVIFSNDLEFNWEKWFVKPTEIYIESIVLQDNKTQYLVYSQYLENKSFIRFSRINDEINATTLETPLLARYRFKDKYHLLNKLKLYLTFS